MDVVVKENLIQFYEENKNFLNLEVPFDEWDSQNESTILISTNKLVKGLFVFKKNTHQLVKMGHKFLPIKSKVYDGDRKYTELPCEMYNGEFLFPVRENGKNLMIKVRELTKSIKYILNENILKKKSDELKRRQKSEQLKQEKFSKSKDLLLNEFDSDGNGIIDVIEGVDDFMKLFRKHQLVVKEFDKDYVNYLVKISNYLKTKRSNIQGIFLEIRKTKNQSQLREYAGMLKNQIHTYELLLFHSLSLINSIVQDDFITVNEIYEEFDKLKIFKSDHEKEVSQKLSDIGDGLSNLMYSINSMERNIVSGLNTLSYVTQDGFSELNSSLNRELQSIDSSLQTNNLLTGIQTYQMYKINKNTKGLIN